MALLRLRECRVGPAAIRRVSTRSAVACLLRRVRAHRVLKAPLLESFGAELPGALGWLGLPCSVGSTSDLQLLARADAAHSAIKQL